MKSRKPKKCEITFEHQHTLVNFKITIPKIAQHH